MRTLFLLSAIATPCVLCAQAPPQSTLPLHLPCEVRPAAPAPVPTPAQAEPVKRPKAGIEETSDQDPARKDAPKGVKDDRQMAMYKTKEDAWKFLASAAVKSGQPQDLDLMLDGKWQRFRATPDGAVSRWVETPQVQPRREVAAAQPFRDVYKGNQYVGRECEYDPDHVCNRCGTVQLEIDHFNPDGTHTHRCPRCGHKWRH